MAYRMQYIMPAVKHGRLKTRGKKMATKRIGCRSCSHYSGSLGRCRLGKINPRTVKDAKNAAKLMGVNYICNMNGIKDNMMNDGIRTWRKTMGV